MFLRRACALSAVILTCIIPVPTIAEPPQSQVVIESDLRVFSMLAALNAAGFDVELGSQYHPVRAELRKAADNLDPDLLKRLRTFYTTHRSGAADEDQLAKYISLAVVLGDPPAFKLPREEILPDDARSVTGFAALLPEFYQKAGVPRLWAALDDAYEAEMDLLGPPIRNAVAKTDSYLRAASGGGAIQSMKITVELAAPQNSVNVRSDGEQYYVVLGYANTPKVDEVRHAYLHLRLNDYAFLAGSKVDKRTNLMALLSGVEGLQRDYVMNFESMFIESLIRAVELRIDREPAPRAEQRLKTYYRAGLLLTPYFYEALATYEIGDDSLRDYVGTAGAAIDFGKEQERFDRTFSTIPLPEKQTVRADVPVTPTVDPVFQLLKSAESVFAKDKALAREAFEKVLRDYDANNGRALYGIGLVEMDKENLDEALKYFERTIASPSADPSMKTWSHIYSGHILDFKCSRAAAIEHYRKALESGDNTRDARRIANRDLLQPFGGECPQ